MEAIDVTIRQLEGLYTTITGRKPPAIQDKPAPASEVDAALHATASMERLLETLRGAPATPAAVIAPALRVWENDHDLLHWVDMPGVERGSVAIALDSGALVVSGRRALPGQNGGGEWRPVWADVTGAEYRRVIPLPFPVSAEAISAQLNHGVLEIRVPRAPEGRGRVPVA